MSDVCRMNGPETACHRRPGPNHNATLDKRAHVMASKNRIYKPRNLQDLTGQRFGLLTAIEVIIGLPKQIKWLCRCDCGKMVAVRPLDLKRRSLSCGCQTKAKRAASMKRHHDARVAELNGSRIDRGTGAVELSNGGVCHIDLADIPLIEKWAWSREERNGCEYALSTNRGPDGRRVFMHVLLMGQRSGFRVDHRDGNGLNNRRSNLRWATAAQNQWNKRRQRTSRSPYKGVWSPNKDHPKWRAAVECNGVRHFLGSFDTAEGAARAYDRKATELFGEFALLNFPVANG